MIYKATVGIDLKTHIFNDVNHFWAIEDTVGWGCRNKYEDVLFIQYMLNSAAKAKRLEPDGIFGPETAKGIKNFQKSLNKRFGGKTCQADGRVSDMDGSRAVTTSDRYYTIHLLNWVYLDVKRIYYNDLTMDAQLPGDLCWAMMK
jgi:peptidoglycan hydrolase-like protein with peptidoglycan-binding domain